MACVYVEDHITRTLADIFDVLILFFNVNHSTRNDIDRVHFNIMPKGPKDKRSKRGLARKKPCSLVCFWFLDIVSLLIIRLVKNDWTEACDDLCESLNSTVLENVGLRITSSGEQTAIYEWTFILVCRVRNIVLFFFISWFSTSLVIYFVKVSHSILFLFVLY